MKVEWNKVTWYSKTLALILFVTLPFIGFYLGIRYERLAAQETSLSSYVVSSQAPNTLVASVEDNSGSGNIRIKMADGRTIVPANDLEDQVGASSPALARDKRTVGWLALYPGDTAGQSYPWAGALIIYRGGSILRVIYPDQVGAIWNWAFMENGTKVAIVSGPTHGTSVGDYQLYDLSTGKLLASVLGPLGADSPQWAREVEP